DLSAEDEMFIIQATRDILEEIAADTPVEPPPASTEEPPAPCEPGAECAELDQNDPVCIPAAPPQTAALIIACPAHHEAEELAGEMLKHLMKRDGYEVEVMSTKMLPLEVVERAAEE